MRIGDKIDISCRKIMTQKFNDCVKSLFASSFTELNQGVSSLSRRGFKNDCLKKKATARDA